jgi:PhnB protein
MVIVTPCFNLQGQCEEAMSLYEKAFDAETRFVIRYKDADRKDLDIPLTDEQKNLIYHAEMYIGSQRIMLSDILEFELKNGNSLFLTITFNDAGSVKKAYQILKEGSFTIYPMKSTTYSSNNNRLNVL